MSGLCVCADKYDGFLAVIYMVIYVCIYMYILVYVSFAVCVYVVRSSSYIVDIVVYCGSGCSHTHLCK